MDTKKTASCRWKKPLVCVCCVIIALVLLLAIVVGALWHNEIATLSSLTLVRDRNDAHLDGGVYTMHVKGDYYMDDFIAQGGVKSDAELVQFVTSKIAKGLIPMNVESPYIGCSSFTATTPEGDKLFARNYDFSKTNTVVVFTDATEDRHATISSVDLQFLSVDTETNLDDFYSKVLTLAAPYAPIDGINDAGVSCGIYMTYQGDETVATDQNTDKPDLTSTTLLRMILDYADSVEDAVAIASAYDLHDSAETSFHYMVADATGKSAILEWIGATDSTDNDGGKRELVVTYNDADDHIGPREAAADYQVITNFILQPGYYEGSAADDQKGLDRYERIHEELARTNGVLADEQAAMDILEIVGRRSWKNDDNNGCTVLSAVYNNTDRTVTWVPNENFDDPNATFTFGFED